MKNRRKKNVVDSSDNLNLQLFQPGSGWSAPEEFPCLSAVRRIGLDMETRDPNLSTMGPGSFRKDGRPAGISIATDDAGWYFPYGHLGGGNMDRDAVIRFVGDTLKNSRLEVVGANIMYELEWLAHEGIRPLAKFHDVQIAEALLDEERDDAYDLGTLSKNYLGQGKDEALLKQAAKDFNVDPKGGLWKLPASFVGHYAVFDAYAPLKIFDKQQDRLRSDDLLQIYDLETRLTPILWRMREQGIPVDLDQAARSSAELKVMEVVARKKLRDIIGWDVDIWSPDELERMCNDRKIDFPRTAKKNASFTADFLDHSEHEELRTVAEIRELDRLRTTFIDKWIFGNHINGIVHPVWKQLKSDDGGTRTGRMAASNPNPQQVPARSDLAHLIRRIFVPLANRRWCKIDYSQQEPRLLVHYADLCGLTGAGLVATAYRERPTMDIYQFLAESTNMARKDAKAATLGRMYGMGFRKFAAMQHISEAAAKKKLEEFDDSVPFVKELADKCSAQVQKRGYIKTVGGRKRHFNYWEPVDSKMLRERGINCMPVMHHIALEKWPRYRLQRAHGHKALNSLIQGSAADMTKQAIVSIWEETKLLPYMQVHDELDTGVESDAQANQLKKIMEEAVPLTVPVRADMHVGDNWHE